MPESNRELEACGAIGVRAGLLVGCVAVIAARFLAGDPADRPGFGEAALLGCEAGFGAAVLVTIVSAWYRWLGRKLATTPADPVPRPRWVLPALSAVTFPPVLAVSLAIAGMLTLPLGLVAGLLIEELRHRPFDALAWTRSVDRRRYMAIDLIESRRLVGLKADEVVRLLGNPSVRNAGQIVYATGGIGIVLCSLTVTLKDGVAVAATHECRD